MTHVLSHGTCTCRQVELPSLEDEGEGEETQFHVELDSSADDRDAAIADSAASALLALTYSRKHVMENEQAEKLDVMMTTCMDHLHMICHHKGESTHATCHML